MNIANLFNLLINLLTETSFRALNQVNVANLGIFSDTAKFYFTLSNISSHFDSNLSKRTNRN